MNISHKHRRPAYTTTQVNEKTNQTSMLFFFLIVTIQHIQNQNTHNTINKTILPNLPSFLRLLHVAQYPIDSFHLNKTRNGIPAYKQYINMRVHMKFSFLILIRNDRR